ncbi:MAG: DNA methyltransferase [Pirellulales bacterium]
MTTKNPAQTANTILCGDCIEGMNGLAAGGVDLAFADPPFNIGYDYDVYDDRQERDKYLAWSRDWIAAVYRVLKPDGAFWLAIGDEYAAELKIESQKIGFHCRSWVVWYYTFGVNCDRKFTRSHAHLFHFVKNPKEFTFRADALENRIPSARQLVYNDKRANSTGRLPDDTWIIRPAEFAGLVDDDGAWPPAKLPAPADQDQSWTLRPQDLGECFGPAENTWYFPRVAGTFKERAGFHGCQMPEQLLARIIRACSEEGELVLDPFSGSATTAAVAKKLGRRYLAFDVSADYVKLGLARLERTRVGDRLDGSAEPLMSAPRTDKPRSRSRSVKGARKSTAIAVQPDYRQTEECYDLVQLEMTLRGIVEAFRLVHDGFSADRVVTDPSLDNRFVEQCRKLGLMGDARTWNILLFRLRKAGKLAHLPTRERTAISWEACDDYFFASEIALELVLASGKAESLDEILCDPDLAGEFDKLAADFAPGRQSFEYRWAALKLRKQAKIARSRGAVLVPPARLSRETPVDQLDVRGIPPRPGVYLLSGNKSQKLYAGEALNLRSRLETQFESGRRVVLGRFPGPLSLRTFLTHTLPAEMLAWQSCLVRKYKPRLNYRELRAVGS